jgi:hypothetical protein
MYAIDSLPLPTNIKLHITTLDRENLKEEVLEESIWTNFALKGMTPLPTNLIDLEFK